MLITEMTILLQGTKSLMGARKITLYKTHQQR